MARGCYTPNYLPASFKGIPFEALDASSEHGRRGAEGEFPFGESTAYADLGRRIRTYSISGRLAENSHVADAAALIAACETPGPGPLVHPTRGVVIVACRSLKISDDLENGQGVTTLDLDFVEANLIGSGFSLGQSVFGLPLASLFGAVAATFVDRFNINSVRYYDANEVRETASQAIITIRDRYTSETIADTSLANWRIISDMTQAASDGGTAQQTVDTIAKSMNLLASKTTGDAKYAAFRSISNWGAQVAALPSNAGIAQDAVYSAVRIMAAGHMARASLETDPETIGAALAQYDQVVSIIDQEIENAKADCDNCLFLELRKFLADAQSAMLNRAYNLPSIVEYDFGGSVHSLVAAYEIFDDAKRFGEIERRNPSSWPFVVGPKVIAARA